MRQKHKFPYRWYLKDGYPANGIEKHGYKVFGTFICGGGSTMGYKLAGFEHLGGVEIDKQVAAVYKGNHNPKYLFNEDIRDFVKREDLPEELFNLDLLDGSPPCSSFSMAGNREKDWNKKKVFREGQAHQKLDDLFFTYIELAKKLQPKIVLAENVKGLIQGNAKFYVSRIKKEFEQAGYKVQLFLLNAASMGVPQKRERVFFICQRKDLGLPELRLDFQEPVVPFGQISDLGDNRETLTDLYKDYWCQTKEGEGFPKFQNQHKVTDSDCIHTIVSGVRHFHNKYMRELNDKEYTQGGTFPLDYNFCDVQPRYLIGMSVPPVMTAQIANQIYLQWLSKI